MDKNKKFCVIGLICLLILTIVIFVSYEKPYNSSYEELYGRWYLYNGNDINTDFDIPNQLNSKDYIEISKGIMETFRSDGKNGVSEMKVQGSEIHSGDAVYKYTINKIDEHKILALELIGYDNTHKKDTIENGEKFIYVFNEKN
ncbi:hypothetical protein R0131_08450 [Clostridium sp. AL.422]|uniref:hypothetical protein n=1 Tax=Clostridium TaxID=1485 RepID=UPI00293DB4C6|nr:MULTISPECIES: hypothetical protein [unclassified Clostridium]MDV4150863.1 hypothetical protein [Clostridium sp. AL.422]